MALEFCEKRKNMKKLLKNDRSKNLPKRKSETCGKDKVPSHFQMTRSDVYCSKS